MRKLQIGVIDIVAKSASTAWVMDGGPSGGCDEF